MHFSRSCRRTSGLTQRFRNLLLVAASAVAVVTTAPAYESGRAAFHITVNDELIVPYQVFSLFVLPGERLQFSGTNVTASATGGDLHQSGAASWEWTAPLVPVTTALQFDSGEDSIHISAVALHPSSQAVDGALKSFRIGHYPAPLEGDPQYAEPDGYIELAGMSAGLQLSPHFRIDQFPSKQPSEFPKYLVLRESLLLKLELLLERVNQLGIAAETFTVMSGFRTPAYNDAIGNVAHSRHIYGGAADIYIDERPRDGVMDDLNSDGVLDYRDAQLLYRIADELFAGDEHQKLHGGLGVYDSTAAHGPFIHLDARGKRARWGLVP